MPAVLVHGVPETPTVWDPLVESLSRPDVVTPRLPGFGAPVADGFPCTKEAYLDWLIETLEGIDGPVDLVAHDWGAILSMRLVSTRPELVRSWVLDNGGVAHADFQWHAMAQLWQTPGEGEAFFEAQLAATDEERAAVLEAAGVPAEHSAQMAAELDETMASAILALYRSATEIAQEWSGSFRDIGPSGLMVLATEDPYGSEDRNRRAAATAGARCEVLDGAGHWWMLERPEETARVIERFWADLGGTADTDAAAT